MVRITELTTKAAPSIRTPKAVASLWLSQLFLKDHHSLLKREYSLFHDIVKDEMNDYLKLRVDLFLLLQHVDELLDPLRSRLGFLGRMNPVKNRVTVAAIQRGEKGFRLRISIQFGLQIVRHDSFAL